MAVKNRLIPILLGIITLMMLVNACTPNGNSSMPEPTLNTEPTLKAPLDTPVTFEPKLNKIKVLALTSLATQLEVEEISLKTTGIELVNWPNASLGCPKPGYLYAQVVTPGYRITFDLNGILYRIHSNLEGTSIVKC